MTTDQRYLTDISSLVRFPTLDGTAVVYQAEVLRQDRAMDSALIEVYPPKDSSTWIRQLRTGVPILLSWTANKRVGAFSGYIHTVTAVDSERLLLTCVGMGYPLHLTSARARADTTSRQIIADICSDYLLEYSTNPAGVQRWNIAQGPDTDWNWLLAVTLREGLSLHFRGATLLCQPFDHIMRQNFRAPTDVVIPDTGLNRSVSYSQSPVRTFTNRASSIVAGAVAQTQNVYGMVTSDGQFANVVTPGTNTQHRVTLDAVSSSLEAQTTLSKRDLQERWTNRAHLEMDGVPSLHPLDLIRTASQDERTVSLVWSILSVKHVIKRNDYTVVCELGEETANRADLLQRRVNEVIPFYRLHRQALGGTEWYTVPALRMRGNVTPGNTQAASWYWTAEQVVSR
jgi:hypothetical protein